MEIVFAMALEKGGDGGVVGMSYIDRVLGLAKLRSSCCLADQLTAVTESKMASGVHFGIPEVAEIIHR